VAVTVTLCAAEYCCVPYLFMDAISVIKYRQELAEWKFLNWESLLVRYLSSATLPSGFPLSVASRSHISLGHCESHGLSAHGGKFTPFCQFGISVPSSMWPPSDCIVCCYNFINKGINYFIKCG
jgi:hypothetical protein